MTNESGAEKEQRINLVNDIVIAIGGSLNAYRREVVKDVFVQMSTFSVINALEDDLNKKMGAGFSSKRSQQRVVESLSVILGPGRIWRLKKSNL